MRYKYDISNIAWVTPAMISRDWKIDLYDIGVAIKILKLKTAQYSMTYDNEKYPDKPAYVYNKKAVCQLRIFFGKDPEPNIENITETI